MDEREAAAVEAVKGSLSMFGQHPYRAVNDTVATDTLARRLDIEESEARQLCRAAVEQQLAGYVESGVRTGGLRAGRQRRTPYETWWVHRDRL